MSPAEAQRLLDDAAPAAGVAHLRVVDEAVVPLADDPGAFLRRGRKALGLSVPQVAGLLKLKTSIIEDIEANHFNKQLGLGYALGFVRTYAELITARSPNPQLVEDVVDTFRSRWEPHQNAAEARRKPLQAATFVPIGAVLGLGLVGWFAVSMLMQSVGPREPEAAVAPPDEAIRAWSQAAEATPGRAVATVDPLVTIHALRDVRITLRGEDGALVADRYMRGGEAMSADGLGRFFITTPDAGALEVRGHGQTVAVGDPGVKADWWRVPDLAAIEQAAIEARRVEAEAAAAAAAGTAAASDAAASAAVSAPAQ